MAKLNNQIRKPAIGPVGEPAGGSTLERQGPVEGKRVDTGVSRGVGGPVRPPRTDHPDGTRHEPKVQ